MNELAGYCLGGYQLEEEIGRGSMGVVYRGKQIALSRDVAVKVLPHTLAKDTSYVARFIREAQIIAGLNHPNIVQIYDAGQQNRILYFVMEFVQGPTLSSLLLMDGIIPQYLAAEYGAQIADALDAAYRERSVIHRDIKPENLMLNRWGKIKVMDFGLARATGHQTITIAKSLVGSIYYSSPEQILGRVLDNRSDIFALGVVLYEMVSGRRPFQGRTMTELSQVILSGKVTPPSQHNPDLPSHFEQIILKSLERDRNQRYEDAANLAQDLRQLHLQPPDSPKNSTSSELSSSLVNSPLSHQTASQPLLGQHTMLSHSRTQSPSDTQSEEIISEQTSKSQEEERIAPPRTGSGTHKQKHLPVQPHKHNVQQRTSQTGKIPSSLPHPQTSNGEVSKKNQSHNQQKRKGQKIQHLFRFSSRKTFPNTGDTSPTQNT